MGIIQKLTGMLGNGGGRKQSEEQKEKRRDIARDYSSHHTSESVLASGEAPAEPCRTVEESYFAGEDGETELKLTMELPENFEAFESHAEPICCHLYCSGETEGEFHLDDPVICLNEADDEIYYAGEGLEKNGIPEGVDSYEILTDCGRMDFLARIDNYFGQIMQFYGFRMNGESGNYWGLMLIYSQDVKDTPLEEKLLKIHRHAAKTYKEEILA